MKKVSLKTLCDILLIVIFCVTIFTPLITINTVPGKISKIENKALAPMSSFRNPDGAINSAFITQLNDYLTDNVGFKEEAVLTNIAGNYKLFNKFKVPNYIMGENLNVFYNSGDKLGIETYQGDNHYSKKELQDLANQLESVNQYFTKNGTDFILMSIPDKENVYPEEYLKTIIQFNNESRLDELIKYIVKNTTVNAFNMKDTFIHAKGNGYLYYRNFDPTHWNMNGAFIGYSELMNRIKSNHDTNIFTKKDFNIVKTETNGSLQGLDYKITNKAMNFHDEIYSYNPIKGYSGVPDTNIPTGINIDLNYNYVHYHNEENTTAPRILVIGDSYIMPLLPMISESFSDLYFTRIPPAAEVEKMVKFADPDVVVLEFVERAYSENIINQLAVLPLTIDVEFPYKDSNLTVMEISYNIDVPQLINGEITINTELTNQIVSGWAFDPNKERTVSKLYLKIGEKFFAAQDAERPDVANFFHNQKYNNSGFTFSIPTKEFEGYHSAELLIVPNDDTSEYVSIPLGIRVQ